MTTLPSRTSIPQPRPAALDDELERLQALEQLASSAYGEADSVTEVIRPAAVLSEGAARSILFELTMRDARTGGTWIAQPTSWSLYDKPWTEPLVPGDARLLGSMHVTYGTPTRYEITVFRATVTAYGTRAGWDVVRLCDSAFAYAGLTLARCPRAQLAAPPKPFRIR
jgi:hypothetical protein